MSGETDLANLLASLAPALDPEPYVFATLAPAEDVPAGIAPLATFREAEGSVWLYRRPHGAASGVPDRRTMRGSP